MPQMDLHRQDIPLPFSRVLDDPEADIFITKRFIIPYRLPEHIEVRGIAVLQARFARHIGLRDVAIIAAFCHKGIYIVTVIAAIMVCALDGVTVGEFAIGNALVLLILLVATSIIDVVVVARPVTSVAIVIVSEAFIIPSSRALVFVGFFRFTERVLAGFALRCMHELCRPTARVSLKEHHSGDVVSIVLGGKDRLVSGPELG
jgi:hypothetical protein